MITKIKKLIPRKFFQLLSPAYHFCLSFLAALFSRFPSRNLIVIGITGTAGKTSTAYLIYKMLNEAGYKTGLTSTAIFSDGKREWLNDKKMTMPGRFFIQKMLKQMVANKCLFAIIETTSEGIKQFRHRFINYDTLIFTNLYPEHIESHGSFKKYKEAKGQLFSHLHRFNNKYVDDKLRVCQVKNGLKKIDYTRVKKTIIVNGDDKQASYFLNFWSEAKIIYSLNPQFAEEPLIKTLSSEFLVKDIVTIKGEVKEVSASGLKIKIADSFLDLSLLGDFNAKNVIAAYALGVSYSIADDKIIQGLKSVKSLVGKMELIEAGQDFKAMVDYSFEPKALENLYSTIKLFSYNKLIHVLGATGGGRDKARRPIMGKLAAQMADIVIITNEDPYDEDPLEIIKQVALGAKEGGKEEGKDLLLILDRREALKKAVMLAEKDDMVLVTGKGAEQFICLQNGKKMPWDDRKELKQAIVDKLCIDKI
ncbi:MAG: UDP-N-acetylmuramoyl-L-alanyl-D-glutamate--2,6-diaminopimelate ligase [Patescibacteria group bacterium]|nr:UDP-N-acetylmuramoyl-L-alanyl-D-glutamate--2,6-diaminopimelate ligase [Patescibacteria group bacterium]